MSLNEFAALVEVDRNIILRKLSAAEFSDDVFTFRRDEILRLLDTKGRRFFSERKIKPPSEFSEVADLEHADQKSIFAAVSKVDTFDLAKLLAVSGDGPVRSKILQSLSRRRREEVESDLKDIGTVDPVEVHHIGKGLVAEIKELMTASTS
jgi:flagellar motor switch protein FliG